MFKGASYNEAVKTRLNNLREHAANLETSIDDVLKNSHSIIPTIRDHLEEIDNYIKLFNIVISVGKIDGNRTGMVKNETFDSINRIMSDINTQSSKIFVKEAERFWSLYYTDTERFTETPEGKSLAESLYMLKNA